MENSQISQGTITGIFRNTEDAEKAYSDLLSKGYKSDEITVLMSDETRKTHFKDADNKSDLGSKAMEKAGIGSAIGGTAGAIIGAIAAIGTSVVIPGLGLVVAGPILAALTGAGAGGLTGGLIGALVGSGIPKERAERYESSIKEGGIVLGVTPRDQNEGSMIANDWRTNYRGEEIHGIDFDDDYSMDNNRSDEIGYRENRESNTSSLADDFGVIGAETHREDTFNDRDKTENQSGSMEEVSDDRDWADKNSAIGSSFEGSNVWESRSSEGESSKSSDQHDEFVVRGPEAIRKDDLDEDQENETRGSFEERVDSGQRSDENSRFDQSSRDLSRMQNAGIENESDDFESLESGADTDTERNRGNIFNENERDFESSSSEMNRDHHSSDQQRGNRTDSQIKDEQDEFFKDQQRRSAGHFDRSDTDKRQSSGENERTGGTTIHISERQNTGFGNESDDLDSLESGADDSSFDSSRDRRNIFNEGEITPQSRPGFSNSDFNTENDDNDRLNIQGNWNEIKGKLKQRYANLTDDDLTYSEGREEEMLGKLQQKTGLSKSELRREINKS